MPKPIRKVSRSRTVIARFAGVVSSSGASSRFRTLLITDFPDRLRDVLPDNRFRLPPPTPSPFDVQGHRGARAVRPENTLAAFGYALANEDVSTLELDTGVTQDDQLVVLHDRTINGSHCLDTAPAFPGDPEFPYVGKRVRDLTLAQIKTLDCGSKTLPEFPRQQPSPASACRRSRRCSSSWRTAAGSTCG
jgi:glycerophosphoryl diester phosphodiesterase